jgi:hypothetical protein
LYDAIGQGPEYVGRVDRILTAVFIENSKEKALTSPPSPLK